MCRPKRVSEWVSARVCLRLSVWVSELVAVFVWVSETSVSYRIVRYVVRTFGLVDLVVLLDGVLHGLLHVAQAPVVRAVLQQHDVHEEWVIASNALIQHLIGGSYPHKDSEVQ